MIRYQKSPPLSAITAGITPQLKRIIFKCIEKDPDNRYQSIEEIIAEMDSETTRAKAVRR